MKLSIQQKGDLAYLMGRYPNNPETIYRIIRRFYSKTISRHDFWAYGWLPMRAELGAY